MCECYTRSQLHVAINTKALWITHIPTKMYTLRQAFLIEYNLLVFVRSKLDTVKQIFARKYNFHWCSKLSLSGSFSKDTFCKCFYQNLLIFNIEHFWKLYLFFLNHRYQALKVHILYCLHINFHSGGKWIVQLSINCIICCWLNEKTQSPLLVDNYTLSTLLFLRDVAVDTHWLLPLFSHGNKFNWMDLLVRVQLIFMMQKSFFFLKSRYPVFNSAELKWNMFY
jgi:hypothetical protein